jgi:hypothetical protein
LTAFVVTTPVVSYYLYTRYNTARGAIGGGLYITALVTPLVPILYMGSSMDTRLEFIGMFIYAAICSIIAVVLFVTGYFVKRGAE